MPSLPPRWAVLLLVLVASVAVAGGHLPVERTLILSEHPRDEAPRVYVGGRVATVLRFEQPCDSARTKMLGWESRFEPLGVTGKMVVLYPLRDLKPEDRLMLRVTLADGTEVPFTVTANPQTFADREVDQQVNVFRDREGYDAVLSSLNDALKRERALEEENARYRKEEHSVDHALAALLMKGAERMTPFNMAQKWVRKDGDVAMEVRVFSGKAKAAVVVQISNHGPDAPWGFSQARLSTTSSRESRPFALRMDRSVVGPGASGTFAFVADRSAFSSQKGLVDLHLEIFRHDGLQQAVVVLERRLLRE
jgi:uncharacterized protein (TIGR02268 family)